MNASVFRSLKKLGYNIGRLGPGWLGLSEMYAYRDDYKSPDAVYSGDRKTLVYTGFDRKERSALREIATDLNMSFAYPLKADDKRVMYCFDRKVTITNRRRNVAFHELLMDNE